MLQPSDYDFLAKRGISDIDISGQLKRFREGINTSHLINPAVIGNGILKLSESQESLHIETYQNSQVKPIKFVPASGAATRMFKVLYQFLEGNKTEDHPSISQFFEYLNHFAFYDDLIEIVYKPLDELNKVSIIKHLLGEEGLGYGHLPKGLLKFHRYKEGVNTPVEEHIEEGLEYAEKGGEVNMHFTVSPEHHQSFEKHVNEVIKSHTTTSKINVSFSTQNLSTDTIAVDLDNLPYRQEDGSLLLRPAGHGALLENLNSLDADIVFIKNIDNVIKKEWNHTTLKYKQTLAGILINYQNEVFSLLQGAKEGKDIYERGVEILGEMGWKGDFSKEEVIRMLNRPIRVCGMVVNEGEPGGGPFWVSNGNITCLQIVESSQVKKSQKEQRKIFESGTHFNPVDLVCGIKNYKGEKFDLKAFRDPEGGIITHKTFKGDKIKALELPGLWNGSMAYWNTIFVEVPLTTFSPVKTVMDLLKKEHC